MGKSSRWILWSGLAAMLGGALGLVLTPILIYLWTTYSDAYVVFGKAYFPVYLGCMAGLLGLDARRRGSSERPETERLALGMILVGLAVALFGDILAYWGDLLAGQPNAGGFTNVQAGGFLLEILGLLILLFGSVTLGVIYLRANVRPRWFTWLLVLAGPVGILLSALHAPSGTMLLFCLAWTGMGYALLSEKTVVAEPARTVR